MKGKRILVIVLCLFTLVGFLTGCNGGTKASDKAVSVAKRAIQVADDYLDGKLSYSEANDKLVVLDAEMDYANDLDIKAENKAADVSISVDITILSSSIFQDYYYGTSESYDKVLNARNSLAEDAGLKKR